MEIVNVQIRERGTAAKTIPSTTAGLTSAYQKMGNATLSASTVATTGGYIVIEMASLPWQLPLSESYVDIVGDSVTIEKNEAAEGYKTMSTENSLFAEECLPVALESWPTWKE
jgi:mRNA interferase MazF